MTNIVDFLVAEGFAYNADIDHQPLLRGVRRLSDQVKQALRIDEQMDGYMLALDRLEVVLQDKREIESGIKSENLTGENSRSNALVVVGTVIDQVAGSGSINKKDDHAEL